MIAKLENKKEGKTTEDHLVKPSFYLFLVVPVWVVLSGRLAQQVLSVNAMNDVKIRIVWEELGTSLSLPVVKRET